MKNHKSEIVKVIGEEKFNEEIELLEKIKEQESKKGNFDAI